MTIELTSVEIDSREPDASNIARFLSKQSIPNRIKLLSRGDFQWRIKGDEFSISVVVERKSINDLVNSLHDGRLGNFVDSQAGSNELDILLVGELPPTRQSHSFSSLDYESIDNLILECQLRGTYVVRYRVLPQRIADLWRWSGKGKHNGVSKPTLPTVSTGYLDNTEKNAVRMLMTIPNWGEEKARNALLVFGTPAAVIDAIINLDYKGFDNVAHVGRRSIDDARRFLTT